MSFVAMQMGYNSYLPELAARSMYSAAIIGPSKELVTSHSVMGLVSGFSGCLGISVIIGKQKR